MKVLKKVTVSLVAVSLIFCLTGCEALNGVNLTEEESTKISEYAAGMLLKHSKNYSGTLVDFEEETDDGIPVVGESKTAKKRLEEEEALANASNNENQAASDFENKEKKSADTKYSVKSLAESIGVAADGFEVTYDSYECKDIYPEQESSDLVFSLQAQQGMKLLVVHFKVANTTDAEKKLDVLSKNPNFVVVINGSEKVTEQQTILLNDLKQYSGNIAGYGSVDAVLVFEVSDSTADNIKSLDLIIKNGVDKTTHNLF